MNKFFGILGAVGELVSDLGKLGKESAGEFHEIMTDGFKEIVIKDNNDYKTSYEKKEEADNIVFSARNKIKRKIEEVQECSQQTEQMLTEHCQYKIEIATKLLTEAKMTITDFNNNLDISRDMIDEPTMEMVKGLENATTIKQLSFSNMITTDIDNIRDHMKRARVAAANEYQEDARQYRDQVNLEVAKMEIIRIKLDSIMSTINDERDIFSRITVHLGNITEELKELINGKELTNLNKQRANSIIKIANSISELLETKFINSDCEITAQYKGKVENLRLALEIYGI